MREFEHVTTDAAVEIYESALGVFSALLNEVRELSKKKPDATLSASKVKLINSVLSDLLTILESGPQGKYIRLLENEELPQVSDALMMMVQFEAALKAFRIRYQHYNDYWITEETLQAWEEDGVEIEEDGEADE